MRRLIFAAVCGLTVAAHGCGDSTPPTPAVDDALKEQQKKQQQEADEGEKALQKQQ